jgi:uncharacterized protein (TIGR02145 family)
MNRFVKIPALLLISAIVSLTACKDKPTPPVLTTANVSDITSATASTGGNVTDDGGAEVLSRGVCWSISEKPTIASDKTSDGTGLGSFTSSLTQLTPNTKYYVRSYATNSEGIGYGKQVTFTTSPVSVPLLTTNIGDIQPTTAFSGGWITSDNGGFVTVRGVCWSTTTNPTTGDNITIDGSDIGSFTSYLTGLSANTTYYVRAYATNIAGTGYGEQIQFTTLVDYTGQTGTVNDIDGNTYQTIGIGGQIWIVENLKTTKFNDGEAIPLVTDNTAWINLTTPGYCWYDNNESDYKATYGALYNWYTVNTGKLCPPGWHVAHFRDFGNLNSYLDMTQEGSGGKIKESGYAHWEMPNTEATNESEFTALPAGMRFDNGTFVYIGTKSLWWTPDENISPEAYSFLVTNTSGTLYLSSLIKYSGLSVRCIKDN